MVEQGTRLRCPYGGCPFEGTKKEVDLHIAYMIMIDDKEHSQEKRKV